MRLLDPRFKYIPAARTDVAATWRRFGFRPTTDAERRARECGEEAPAPEVRVPTPRRPRRLKLNLAASE
jgi:hypothetical protein